MALLPLGDDEKCHSLLGLLWGHLMGIGSLQPSMSRNLDFFVVWTDIVGGRLNTGQQGIKF